MKYGIIWKGHTTTVLVSIYATDGTVSIAHGGVEIGQGINTKVRSRAPPYCPFPSPSPVSTLSLGYHQVAQVAAKTLGIDISLVVIKPTNTLTNPNGSPTGGSINSELNCKVFTENHSYHPLCVFAGVYLFFFFFFHFHFQLGCFRCMPVSQRPLG